MSDAKVKELNSLLNEGSNRTSNSYGIRNLNDRIKQTYGEKYGLRYVENEDKGITAVILIPVVKNIEHIDLEGYNVKDGNSR